MNRYRQLGILEGFMSVMEVEIPALPARMLRVSSFVGLFALGAHVRFFLPGTPVPVTLQTLFVLLAGAMLGTAEGVAAAAAYIALGAFGMPMFAAGGAGGAAYLAGPTGGYLLGFLVSIFFLGRTIPRISGKTTLLLAFLAAEAIILSLGVIRLSFFLDIGLGKAAALGALPFLYGDALKAACAFTLFLLLSRWNKRDAT